MWSVPPAMAQTGGGDGATKQASSQAHRTWVVGLGDSYMSGEGATWAGKNYAEENLSNWTEITYGQNLQQTYPGDYDPSLTGDLCHRAASAAMFYGALSTYSGKNLACSGAQTFSFVNKDGSYKPGLDASSANGKPTQITMLTNFAKDVTARGDDLPVVMVSIGGNDMGFADVVADCAERFVTPLSRACYRTKGEADTPVGQAFIRMPQVADNVAGALTHVKEAMDAAGRDPNSYTIVYQIPPSVLPTAKDMWWDLGGDHTWGRQDFGGCPFTDGDLTMFHDELAPQLRDTMIKGVNKARAGALKDVKVTVLAPSFSGHELCSKYNPPKAYSTSKVTTTPPYDQYSGEGGTWATPIIIFGIQKWPDLKKAKANYPTLMQSLSDSIPAAQQLPMHPNYWGQRAISACENLVADNATMVGKVVDCGPAAAPGEETPLDAMGRPTMAVTKVTALS